MKFKIFIYAVYIFIIVLLQVTLFEYIKVINVKPNVLIIFIVAVALLRGNVEGAAVGFFSGLAQDLVSGKVIGFYALFGLYLGLAVGSVNKRLYRENFLVIILFTFVTTTLYESLIYLTYMWSQYISVQRSELQFDFLYLLKTKILVEAVYNSALSVPLFIPIVKLHYKLQDMSKVSRKY